MCGVHEDVENLWSPQRKQNVDKTSPPGREFVQDGKFGKSVKFVESIKILRMRPASHSLSFVGITNFDVCDIL